MSKVIDEFIVNRLREHLKGFERLRMVRYRSIDDPITAATLAQKDRMVVEHFLAWLLSQPADLAIELCKKDGHRLDGTNTCMVCSKDFSATKGVATETPAVPGPQSESTPSL